MSGLPSFHSAFVVFGQDASYKEGANITSEKDITRKEFDMDTFRQFTYKEQLGK